MADIRNWGPRGESNILLGHRNSPEYFLDTMETKVLSARDSLMPEGPFRPSQDGFPSCSLFAL